jgi:hypothetical protein
MFFTLLRNTFFVSIFLSGSILVHAVSNTMFIITNAETPSLLRPGLTPIGLQRADECIPNILKTFNIGMVLSCTSSKGGNKALDCNAAQRTAQSFVDNSGLSITTW